MKITTVGLDLAKNVFQAHGVNEHGKVVVRKQLRRDQVAAFFTNLPACLVGMEACSSAHHWARKLESMGHTARLMAPQFVKPYVESNKSDAAEALCSDQERRTAGSHGAAPRSPGLRKSGEIETDDLVHLEKIADRWIAIAGDNRRRGHR